MKPGLRKIVALILASATLFGSGASAVSAAYADDTTMGTSTRIQAEPDVKTTTGGDEAATKPDTGSGDEAGTGADEQSDAGAPAQSAPQADAGQAAPDVTVHDMLDTDSAAVSRLRLIDRITGTAPFDKDNARGDDKDALDGARDGDVIVFTITNTSKDEDGHGAWFKASDLKLEDHTIVGDGEVKDLKYPDNWSTLVLKPGQSVEVTGTLTGFTKDRHTDRAKVTGTPLVECPVVDKDPFGDASGKPSTGGEAGDGDGPRQVTVGDRTLCEDTPVESNTDDWNGRRSLLGETGSAILPVGVGALLMAGIGAAVVMVRRRKSAHDDTDAALMPRHAA